MVQIVNIKIDLQNSDDYVEDLIEELDQVDRDLELPGWENTKEDVDDLVIQRVYLINRINRYLQKN